MKIEIRNVRREMINLIPNNCYIAIGNEYCVDKFLRDSCNIDSSLVDKNLVLVTPRIPEFSMKRTIDIILYMQKNFNIRRIVVNDYGLLYAMASNLEKNIQIVIGRTLSKNLNYCPWAAHIMYQENSVVKRNKYSSNLVHESKVSFWKKYGVSGVEVCTDDLTDEFLSFMNVHNIDVFCHYDTVIASIGRVCHLKRLDEFKENVCAQNCTDKVTLKMIEAWSGYWNSTELLSEEVKTNLPEFRCLGTAIYYVGTPCDNENINIIYDYLFDEDSINKMIQHNTESCNC